MWELWVARHFFHQGVKNIGQLADVLIRLEKYTDILGMELTMSVHNLKAAIRGGGGVETLQLS